MVRALCGAVVAVWPCGGALGKAGGNGLRGEGAMGLWLVGVESVACGGGLGKTSGSVHHREGNVGSWLVGVESGVCSHRVQESGSGLREVKP